MERLDLPNVVNKESIRSIYKDVHNIVHPMERKKKPITKEGAISRLESLCSRSEQCEYDLEQKMFRWGLPKPDREEVMAHLKEHRYVDNARFARSYANDKARFSSWGPFKIRIELAKKRIPGTMITEALQNVEQDVWREGLWKIATSKARSLDIKGEDGYDDRQKLYRYLLSRGFPSKACSSVIRKLLQA